MEERAADAKRAVSGLAAPVRDPDDLGPVPADGAGDGPGEPPAAGAARIDAFLPTFDFSEVHARRVRAPRARVFAVIRTLTARDVPLLVPLMWLRGLPALLAGRDRGRGRTNEPILGTASRAGFLILEEEAEREVVVGLVGKFWRPVGNEALRLPDSAAFVAFDREGYAKAALNFRLEDEGDGCRVTTETRIRATDPGSRRRFALYWALIRPGSGLIRRAWLGAIARRAEAPPA